MVFLTLIEVNICHIWQVLIYLTKKIEEKLVEKFDFLEKKAMISKRVYSFIRYLRVNIWLCKTYSTLKILGNITWIRRMRIQLEDHFWSLISPIWIFSVQLSMEYWLWKVYLFEKFENAIFLKISKIPSMWLLIYSYRHMKPLFGPFMK